MFAGEWNTLSQPNSKVVGPCGVLMGSQDGSSLVSPTAIANGAAWYDLSDTTSLIKDSSDRIQLISDKSGNSGTVSGVGTTPTSTTMVIDGSSGAYASAPSYIPGSGIFRVEVETLQDDYTPTSRNRVCGVWDTTGDNRSWSLGIETTGALRFSVSDNGELSGINNATSDAFIPDGTRFFAATANTATGETDFEISSDGITWTALGTQQVYTTGLPYSGSTADLTVGAANAGTGDFSAGEYYSVKLYFNGASVFDANFIGQNVTSQTFVEGEGETVTLNGTARWSYGSSGGTNALVLPGVAGNYASTPDSAALDVAGDIDLIAKIALGSYASGSFQHVISKYNVTSNQRSYIFQISDTGYPALTLSEDGTAVILATSSETVSSPAFTETWIRATWRSSDGRVQFFESSDGVNWSQLGTDQSAVIASIYNSSANVAVGAINAGSNANTDGLIYRAIIKSGIDGTTVFDMDFGLAPKLATSVTALTGQTVTINQTSIALPARIHGARDLYQGLSASQPSYLGWSGTNYAYLNGVSGNYFSTPDSASLDITSDITLIAYCESQTWESAVFSRIISKEGSNTTTSYALGTTSAGNGYLSFVASSDGTLIGAALLNLASTTGVPFSNGESGWVAAAFDADNGASGNTVRFYTSTDSKDTPPESVGWTILGSPVTTAGTFSIFNSTSAINIGSRYSGTSAIFAGNVYRATIVSGGLTDAAVADFNVAKYPLTGGSTFDDSAEQTELISSLSAGGTSPDTLSVSGTSVLSCIDDGTGIAQIISGTFSLVSGQRYKVTIPNFIKNSGSYPEIKTGTDINLTTGGGLNQTYAGESEIIFTANATGSSFRLGWRLPSIATNFSHGALSIKLAPQWTINGGAKIVNRTTAYGDGTSDVLKSAPDSTEQPATIYWIGQIETWTASDYLFDGNATDSGAVIQTTSTPQVNLNAGSSVAANTTAALKTFGIFTAIFNGANSSLTFNSLTPTTGDAGAADMGGTTLLARGAADAGWLNGSISEFLKYSAAHDTTTQTRVKAYAARKWRFSV